MTTNEVGAGAVVGGHDRLLALERTVLSRQYYLAEDLATHHRYELLPGDVGVKAAQQDLEAFRGRSSSLRVLLAGVLMALRPLGPEDPEGGGICCLLSCPSPASGSGTGSTCAAPRRSPRIERTSGSSPPCPSSF